MGTGGSRNGGFDDERWLPIKFGPVSNGEFHPLPHSPFVREVIRRTHRLADDNARRLGISRREFLTGVTGAAATLFVLGACSKEEAAERGESPGGTLDVSEDATTDTRAALEDLGGEEPNSNVYAELGGTWWFVMRDPTVAAHTLGKLLTYVGEDRVVWGTIPSGSAPRRTRSRRCAPSRSARSCRSATAIRPSPTSSRPRSSASTRRGSTASNRAPVRATSASRTSRPSGPACRRPAPTGPRHTRGRRR